MAAFNRKLTERRNLARQVKADLAQYLDALDPALVKGWPDQGVPGRSVAEVEGFAETWLRIARQHLDQLAKLNDEINESSIGT